MAGEIVGGIVGHDDDPGKPPEIRQNAAKNARIDAILTPLLIVLFILAVGRLWLLPLPSSFWVDEMVTAFVVHYGASHPSLAVAPQLAETIYYWLPAAAEKLFGFSEVVYRLPSTLLMGVALFVIARLAIRLIDPNAGWFVVFACLTLRLINYEAADARPYALGTCVAALGLWSLVRWLDTARWRDALLFILFAAMLWRVHLVFWPFYMVFAVYAVVRLAGSSRHSITDAIADSVTDSVKDLGRSRDTQVSWGNAALVFGLLTVALVPVLLQALVILRAAKAHVIVEHAPTLSELNRSLKFTLVLGCGFGAMILSRVFQRSRTGAVPSSIPPSVFALIGGWWLIHPLSLFVFSRLTGNSVFVDRYLSLSLPGAALAATLAAAYFLPGVYFTSRHWKISSAALGLGVVLFMGRLGELKPLHHNSNFREASRKILQLGLDPSTPVLYPSPFIEAQSPVWQPDYSLPGFLYCHLLIYPAGGTPYLLPFKTSPEAERYASEVTRGPISSAGRFVIYGGDLNIRFWRKWFASKAELAGWHSRPLGPFGDVEVVVFERPVANTR